MGKYLELGTDATDGATVTTGNSQAVQVIGTWTWEADDARPGDPAGALGMRRTVDGSASYTRWRDPSPTSQCFSIVAGFWITGSPSAHLNLIRVTPEAESNLANVYLRTNRAMRAYLGSTSISASESPVLSLGLHFVEYRVDRAASTLGMRVYDPDWTVEHEWVGTGQSLSADPTMARVGEPQATTHGINPLRVASGIRWGTVETGEWLANYEPAPPAPVNQALVTVGGAWVDGAPQITQGGAWVPLDLA